MIIPVLRRRRFDFGYLAATTSQSVTLQPAVDVSQFYYVQLWVRVHERDMSTGQTLVLSLYNTLPDEEDPREFTGDSLLDITLTSVAPPVPLPALTYRDGSSPGPYLKLVLTATQTSVTTALYAELSAVLNVRAA